MFLQNATSEGDQEAGKELAEEAAKRLPESASVARDAVVEWISDLIPATADQPLLVTGLAVLAVLVLAVALHFLASQIVVRLIHVVMRRSRFQWDDVVIEHKAVRRLVPIVPLLVINWGVLAIPHLSDEVTAFIQRLAMATIVVVAVRAVGSLIGAVNAIYSGYEISRGRPIKGYLQVVMILAWFVAAVIVIAAIVDRSPLFFLSGLGAMTAVLLLIFRDSILSLVAGIQLSSNDLIRVGDWIEMPTFNADGDVIDIALNVVKVQNFDRTVTVIPAHKFLEYSFKNWRPMFESGGRRIKRAIHLDVNSIRFLTPEEIARLSRLVALHEYLQTKTGELAEWNKEHVPEDAADLPANRRALTNIGTFRAYIVNYLKRHPKVHQEMTLLVRQLEPGPQGLPIEVYCFTNDTGWASYEGIQADIFDHLLAVVGEFGLRVFQQPSGGDLSALGTRATLAQEPAESET